MFTVPFFKKFFFFLFYLLVCCCWWRIFKLLYLDMLFLFFLYCKFVSGQIKKKKNVRNSDTKPTDCFCFVSVFWSPRFRNTRGVKCLHLFLFLFAASQISAQSLILMSGVCYWLVNKNNVLPVEWFSRYWHFLPLVFKWTLFSHLIKKEEAQRKKMKEK